MAMASMVRRTSRLVAHKGISDAAGRQPEQVAAASPPEVGTPAVTSSRSAAPIAIACTLGILAVFIADLNTPTQVTVSALGVFPIAAAAWLLSRRAMLSVLLLAILAEVVLGFYGAISLVSAAAAVSTFIAVVLLVRAAAQGFAAVTANHDLERELRERIAIDHERARISQDLHDGAVQAIFAVGMGLQAVSRATDDDLLRVRLRNEAKALDGVIDDLRAYILGLVPGVLSDRDLAAALTQMAAAFSRTTGVACEVDIDNSLAAELDTGAASVVQMANEALSNIARHAHASRVSLTLRRSGADAVFEVRDDGCGFEPAAVATRGHGLRNFAGRAEGLGGRIRVESAAGNGTVVRVVIPAAAAAAAIDRIRPSAGVETEDDQLLQLSAVNRGRAS
jgi:signal transduction histidine kinase